MLSLKNFLLFVFLIFFVVECQAQVPLAELSRAIYSASAFVENKGQIQNQFHKPNREVKFFLAGKNMNILLKQNSFSYDTYETNQKTLPKERFNPIVATGKSVKDTTLLRFHRVDIDLIGANTLPEIICKNKQSAYTIHHNSLNGEAIKASQFGKIVYKEIYPSIDLVFDTKDLQGQSRFEYYFIVRPGGDAQKIKLRYNGAETKLSDGKIIIDLSAKKIEEHIPASFVATQLGESLQQLKDNPSIPVTYRKWANNIYGFKIPVYDKTKPLVIDPTPDLVWGTYLGGPNGQEKGMDIILTPDNTLIMSGAANNPNLATSGSYQSTLYGFSDGIIAKFTRGGKMLWISYFGGESFENIAALCADGQGNIFITGLTDSKTGIATPGTHQSIHGDLEVNGRDVYVAKFNPEGFRIWGTYFGGDEAEEPYGIDVDEEGMNVYVVGYTLSPNGIATAGALQEKFGGGQIYSDAFVAAFNTSGKLNWATYIGSTAGDGLFGVLIDKKGDICVAGETGSNIGIATPGAFKTSIGSSVVSNAMIIKFNQNGQRLWGTYFGGDKYDYARTLANDSKNNLIIAGTATSEKGISSPGTAQPGYVGLETDGFVAKFDESGKWLWGTYYGGDHADFIEAVTVDKSDNVLFGGTSWSTYNITTDDAYQRTGDAAFLAKLDSHGKRIWGTYYGYGNFGGGSITGIITDNDENIFVTGATGSNKGISTCGAYQENYTENYDIFVAMFTDKKLVSEVLLTIVSSKTSICKGENITLQAAVVNGGAKPVYQWKINGANVGNDQAVFSSENLKNGDTVTCSVRSNSACITNPLANSNPIKITVSQPVIPSIAINAMPQGKICAGETITFSATTTNAGPSPSFRWEINGSDKSINAPNFATSQLKDGDNVKCILTNIFSCSTITSDTSNTLTAEVSAVQIPSVTISTIAPDVCTGKEIVFLAHPVNAGNNPAYRWTVNGSDRGTNPLFTSTSLTTGDTIQCFMVPAVSGCVVTGAIASNKVAVKVFPAPDFKVRPENPVIHLGDSLQLFVEGAINIARVEWRPAENINNATSTSPVVWPRTTQTYTLLATSLEGCVASKPVIVQVIAEIISPNAFSPNGDGINDFWRINGLELYPNSQITIFTRYGQAIYKSIGYKKSWDGMHNGKNLPVGTYYYIIDLRDGSKPVSGSILLLR